jgi:murein DD-endopeptidase MepM/ murein hydrolase activator NlpD
LKRAHSQEPSADSSHSCVFMMTQAVNQAPSGSNCRATSAAMLGLALSMGASGVLLADGDASAAIDLQSASTTSKVLSDFTDVHESVESAESLSPQVEPQSQTVYHTVEQGESLWKIAQQHRVAVQDIKAANGIAPDILLQVGQVLKVPTGESVSGHGAVALMARSVEVKPSSSIRETTPDFHLLADRNVSQDLEIQPSSTASDTVESQPLESQPVIVSVAEMTQDDSLRSAGLVSNSDGFRQELVRLETLEAERQSQAPSSEAIESSLPRVNSLLPGTAGANYRVRPGDTLGSIAQSLGITAEELIQANGLADPNVLLAGDTLVVPDTVRTVSSEPRVPVVMAATTEPVQSGSDDTRLARLQSTVENRVQADRLLKRLQGDQASNAAVSGTQAQTSELVADPYAANILSQVESARQHVETHAVGGAEPVTLSASPARSDTEVAVNPEFESRRDSAVEVAAVVRNAALEPSAADSELLAAAPLGAGAYSPLRQPEAGQVVSPDMPILPGAGEYLPDAPARFTGYIWPTRGTLTSGYGWRWGRMHRGVDVAGPVGTPIMAAAPGVVERSGWNSGGYGNLVEIRHADGSMTRYAHNSRLLVRAGQEVRQGQQIAEMGSTGYSTGPHLHFEIHLPNQGTVNPMAYLPQR